MICRKCAENVMSGIPSTFNSSRNYTVLGRGPAGRDNSMNYNISVIQLIRGRKYQRVEDIRRLAAKKIADTIVVMPRDASLPLDDLTSEFPHLRIVLFPREMYYDTASAGSLINISMGEAKRDLVCVIWNDMELHLSESAFRGLDPSVLCFLPLLKDSKGNPVPSLFVPAGNPSMKSLTFREPLGILPDGREQESLLAADYCGVYNRQRFIRSGGYDEELTNQHWQKLEFGYRSRLWGERFVSLNALRFQYLETISAEESTPDEDYLRFYLKTLAVRYTGDRAELPWGKFWPFYRAGRIGVFQALDQFRRLRKWVREHRYNFRWDVRQMIELWGEHHVF